MQIDLYVIDDVFNILFMKWFWNQIVQHDTIQTAKTLAGAESSNHVNI